MDDFVLPAPGSEGDREIIRIGIPLTRMVDYGLDLAASMRILGQFEAGGVWEDIGEREADRWLTLAKGGAGPTRIEMLRTGVAALFVAQLGINRDNDRKRALYARLQTALSELAAELPGILELARIPFRDGFINATLQRASPEPAPSVIVFGGMNGWGPAYLSQAGALAARGVHALVVELPGQGYTRLVDGLYGGPDLAAAVSACADWLADDAGVTPRFGVWGNSFGSLFAALAAASDDRFLASCMNGGPADPKHPSFPVPPEFLSDFFGSAGAAEIDKWLDALTFLDRGYRLASPLVLYAGADRIFNIADQQPLFDAGGSTAHWAEWVDGEHALYNHPAERNAIASDWFARHLLGSTGA